jgi:hypothetical protein
MLLPAGREVRAEEIILRFEASPPVERLSPQGEPATLALTATSSDGRPIAEGWVAVRLDAPPSGFFSTDFPLVEGSRLLEMRLPLVGGKAEWRQVFPIRGAYRLAADVTDPAGVKNAAVFSFQVYESNRKWLILGGFALGLFITGVIAGRVFSAPRHGARMKLHLWLLLFFACGAAAAKWTRAQEAQQRKHMSKLAIGPAAVGAPARIQWWLHPAGVDGQPSAKLTLTIAHVEMKKEIFALEKISVAGEFALDYQFTDGSEHRVTAVAETGDGETVRQEQAVSVTASPPPLGTKVPPLILFITVIAAGLVAGRSSRGVGVSKR